MPTSIGKKRTYWRIVQFEDADMDRVPYLDLQAQYDRIRTAVLALGGNLRIGQICPRASHIRFRGEIRSVLIPKETSARCLLEKRPPLLSADPNPVPAGQESGKTTVSWDTCDGSIGRVFVSIDEGQEVIIADGRCGALDRNRFHLRISPLQFRSHGAVGKCYCYKNK